MCFNNEKGTCIVLWIRKSALNVRVQQCRIHVLFVSLGETSVWSIVLALIWKRCVAQWCCCGVRTGIKQILYIHTYGDGCCSVGRIGCQMTEGSMNPASNSALHGSRPLLSAGKAFVKRFEHRGCEAKQPILPFDHLYKSKYNARELTFARVFLPKHPTSCFPLSLGEVNTEFGLNSFS